MTSQHWISSTCCRPTCKAASCQIPGRRSPRSALQLLKMPALTCLGTPTRPGTLTHALNGLGMRTISPLLSRRLGSI